MSHATTRGGATSPRIGCVLCATIGVGISQPVPIGGIPVNFGVQARYWVDGPSTAPEWRVRFQATLVLR